MEKFDILDENGNVTGTASRREFHSGSFLLHAVVHVLVFRSDGRLLLQKRSDTKDIQPGKWDTSVGGHLESGETLEHALEREAEEELGITGADYEKMYSYIMTSDVEREMVTTYRCIWDGPVVFPPHEIDGVRAFTENEIGECLGTEVFTPNFEEEWARFLEWRENHVESR